MTKELDKKKNMIQQIVFKRGKLLELKQQEKIALVKEQNLSDVFSMLTFTANDKINELKTLMRKLTVFDKEIEESNKNLEAILASLKEDRTNYLEMMKEIEKKSGKKRMFSRNNKRVAISEKYFNRYVSFYNSIEEIDNLIFAVEEIIQEKIQVRYEINEQELVNLTDEELMNYYASLAALILCEDVINPIEVYINRSQVVSKMHADTLVKCFNGYFNASQKLQKRKHQSKFKLAIKNGLDKVKKIGGYLFGKKEESRDFMALKKSFAILSLTLGLGSYALNQIENSKLEVINTLSNEEVPVTTFDSDSILAVSNIITRDSLKHVLKESANSSDNTDFLAFRKEDADFKKLENNLNAFGNLNKNVLNDSETDIKASFINHKEDTTVLSVNLVDDDYSVISPIVNSNDEAIVLPEATAMESTDISFGKNNNLIEFGMHLTFDNTVYKLSMLEIKALYYVTKHEYNGTYEDALAIVSTVMNRVEDPRYPNDVVGVLSAENQFVVWDEVLNEISKYGDDFVMIEPIYNAMNDVLNRGIRNHDYVEFKASWTGDYSVTNEPKVQIVEGGNKYHNPAVFLDRTDNSSSETVETIKKSLEKVKSLKKIL